MDNATTQLQFYLHSSWASSVPGRCTCIWTNAITALTRCRLFAPMGSRRRRSSVIFLSGAKTDLAHPPPQMAYAGGEKLHGWYKTVNRCTIRKVKSARDAIKSREDNVLNYFIARSTNASAESLNSKMKAFRAQLRGVSNLPFFMYRLSTIFG